MSAETSLQITSMTNNAWSVFNNYQAGDNDNEAIRSLFLFGIDLLNLIISKVSNKNNLSNSAEIILALTTIQTVNDRFLINVDKYNIFVNKNYRHFRKENDGLVYRNGKIPKQLIHDIIADATLVIQNSLTVTDKVVELSTSLLGRGASVAKTASKMVSPISIGFNFISAFFTQLSNRLAQAKNAIPNYDNDTEFDAKDFSFSSYLAESLIDTVRPLQKSPSLDNRNPNTGFRLFPPQITPNFTQIPP